MLYSKKLAKMNQKQIECKNLCVGYSGVSVKSDINIVINEGDFVCVVGDNGSGKSTLVKTLLGLIRPIDGNIEFYNNLKNKNIGYLPQQTQIQKDFPAYTWEVVLSGHINKHGLRPFYTKKEKEFTNNILKKVGIFDLKKTSFSKLSGGQQQKVLLARALCATSELILLDEPTSALDPNATEEMYRLIKELNDEGTTVIMITHDIKNSLEYSDYVLDLSEGVTYLPKNEYLARAKSCNCNL